jgi:hypothetical protein
MVNKNGTLMNQIKQEVEKLFSSPKIQKLFQETFNEHELDITNKLNIQDLRLVKQSQVNNDNMEKTFSNQLHPISTNSNPNYHLKSKLTPSMNLGRHTMSKTPRTGSYLNKYNDQNITPFKHNLQKSYPYHHQYDDSSVSKQGYPAKEFLNFQPQFNPKVFKERKNEYNFLNRIIPRNCKINVLSLNS